MVNYKKMHHLDLGGAFFKIEIELHTKKSFRVRAHILHSCTERLGYLQFFTAEKQVSKVSKAPIPSHQDTPSLHNTSDRHHKSNENYSPLKYSTANALMAITPVGIAFSSNTIPGLCRDLVDCSESLRVPILNNIPSTSSK